jgi:peptidoglycan/xylan/chitin deacetylase (PgdA/CDA1 family)
MSIPTRDGGVATELDGGYFPEEYPTDPASYVLNGAIFALWGLRDVGVGLGDSAAMDLYEQGVDTMARGIDRFDTGSWSLYDLFPHPIPNVASGAYHQLHITQLEALDLVSPRPELASAAERFRAYQRSRAAQAKATATKVAFRLVVPRKTSVAERLPWRHRPDHGEVLVLCYHAVSDTWPSRLSVSTDQLESQIGRLLKRGYEGVTFSDAVFGDPEGKRVAVTFDDGYESMLTAAAPVLASLGVPGTVFVPTDFPGTKPLCWPGIEEWVDDEEHAHEVEPLTWDQVRELEAAGWEIGSHTCSHPRLPTLEDEELAAELVNSRLVLESELGHPVRSIAYPYGAVDERVILAARDAGYLTGAALPTRFETPRALSWPRVGIYRADNDRAFAIKSSRSLRWIRTTGAWTLAEHVSKARNVASARLIS